MKTEKSVSIVYEQLIRPFLLRISGNDPEKLHQVFLSLLHHLGEREGLVRTIETVLTYSDSTLEQNIFGLKFRNPIGIGAGFDKNAVGVAILGVGFEEIGTITPLFQKGFQPPRIWYLPEDKALINKMGFPNNGTEATVIQLAKIKKSFVPVGINIGKGINTPIEEAVGDYLYCLEKLYPFGDFFVVNVSCPHMPGLFKLREKEYFDDLVCSLIEKIREITGQTGLPEKPLLVKISPDDSRRELNELLDTCLEYHIDGIIAVNTTLSREGLSISTNKEGGMSGKPLFEKTVNTVRYVNEYVQEEIPIIGVGGIFDAKDAYEVLKAGASLIQTYTGYIYHIYNPFYFYQINKGIKELMDRDGIKNLSDLRK
ncbi:quinone-dependent dihydroorotate dehydrogenase [Candidatus Parcubacteria bacterium]|nr:quinone-dependent dihydroorotate dehydrogenase [Candidatus Parcubacteria bacterium]